MAINLTKSPTYIQKKGGDKWALIECDANGSSTGSWTNGTYRSKSDFEKKTKKDTIYDESGAKVKIESSDVDVTLKITSLQADAQLEKFIQSGTSNKYFSILMSAGKDGEETNKIRYMPICQISSDYKESAPGREIEINIDVLENESDITPSSLPTWVTVSSSSLTVFAGQYWSVTTQTGSIVL